MKTPTSNAKLTVKKSTLRDLTNAQLSHVVAGAPSGGRPSQNPSGGSISQTPGTSVISIGGGGTSVISILPSGG